MGGGIFAWCDSLREVICYSAYVAPFFNIPAGVKLIYLGGPLFDLPEKYRKKAAGGFIYALQEGIAEVNQWREEYLEYIRGNVKAFIKEAKDERPFLLFLIREKLLDKRAIKRFLKQYEDSDDTEVKDAILQYYQEQFGTGSPEDR